MGLQKYRSHSRRESSEATDTPGKQQTNGGIPFYTNWVGGPTLALVRNCKCENKTELSGRTVYIRSEPDTMFSIPAACTYKKKTVTGYITTDDNGEYVFRSHTT